MNEYMDGWLAENYNRLVERQTNRPHIVGELLKKTKKKQKTIFNKNNKIKIKQLLYSTTG